MPEFSIGAAPWTGYDVRNSVKTAGIGEGIKSIASYTFYRNENLKSVTFESNSKLEKINKYSFSYTGIESIVLPSSLKTIE